MTDNIKLKQHVLGFNANTLKREELFVQVTKDEIGTLIGINEYIIPLEPLGLEIIKLVKGEN